MNHLCHPCSSRRSEFMRTERSGPATRSSTMVGKNSDLRVAWAGMLDYKMAWQPADQDVTMSQTEQSPELAGVMKADERRLARSLVARFGEAAFAPVDPAVGAGIRTGEIVAT